LIQLRLFRFALAIEREWLQWNIIEWMVWLM
jgi:hypothetical protein